jgi:hypothetical protein
MIIRREFQESYKKGGVILNINKKTCLKRMKQAVLTNIIVCWKDYYMQEIALNGIGYFFVIYSIPSKLIILSNICFKNTIIKNTPVAKII